LLTPCYAFSFSLFEWICQVVSTAKTAALAAGNELPITVCGCSLLPGKDSPREHAKSSQIPDACNILDCYRLVSFYIFSFPHQGTLKHQSACTLPIPTEATSWIEHRQQQIPNVQTSILQHFARQQLGDSSSTILTPSGALNIPMPLVSLESHQYPAFDGPLSERSELPPFLHADLLDLMDEGAAMVFDTPNVFTDEWSEDYDTRQHPSVNVSGASASVTNAMDDERHIVPYCIGVQRVSSSHEFELDFQAVHGYKEATAISNEYAFVQRLMMGVPAALQRGGPMTLDLLRRFGWELLCEPRVSLMGLQIVPLLAVRCSLLHSLVPCKLSDFCCCHNCQCFIFISFSCDRRRGIVTLSARRSINNCYPSPSNHSCDTTLLCCTLRWIRT
jgi:hypothetical protein